MSKLSSALQAFPYSGVGDDLNYSKGMSLRDYFAAKALQGLLAHPASDSHGEKELALQAFHLADAMVKARSI